MKYLSDSRLGYQPVDRKEVAKKVVEWLTDIIVTREQQFPFTENRMSKKLLKAIQSGNALDVWEEIQTDPKYYIQSVDPETLTSFVNFYIQRKQDVEPTNYREHQEIMGIFSIIKKFYHDQTVSFDYMMRSPILPSKDHLMKIINDAFKSWISDCLVFTDYDKKTWYIECVIHSHNFEQITNVAEYVYRLFSELVENVNIDIGTLISSASKTIETYEDSIIKYHNSQFKGQGINKIKIDKHFKTIPRFKLSITEEFYVNFGRKLNRRMKPSDYLDHFLTYMKTPVKIIYELNSFQSELKKRLAPFVWYWYLPSAFVSNGISKDVIEKSRKHALLHGVTKEPYIISKTSR
jgi:hypothetical protein